MPKHHAQTTKSNWSSHGTSPSTLFCLFFPWNNFVHQNNQVHVEPTCELRGCQGIDSWRWSWKKWRQIKLCSWSRKTCFSFYLLVGFIVSKFFRRAGPDSERNSWGRTDFTETRIFVQDNEKQKLPGRLVFHGAFLFLSAGALLFSFLSDDLLLLSRGFQKHKADTKVGSSLYSFKSRQRLACVSVCVHPQTWTQACPVL